MIRSYNPECVLILNADRLPQNGNWDLACVEGRGTVWDCWPGEYLNWLYPMLADWPKTYTRESHRMVTKTPTEGKDWPDYLKMVISLVGEGYIADFDHTVNSSEAWAKEAGVPSTRITR